MAHFYRLFLILDLLCLQCLAKTSSNVLFIVVDDLRPVLGAYGSKVVQTPHLDRLASNGVIFDRAFAQQALCAPSRNSFLTSRRPETTRLFDFYSYFRQFSGNFTTLPQYFKENGYDTYSIGKIFHPGISSNFSDDMPYSWSRTPFHPSTEVFKNAAVCPGDDGKRYQNLLCPVDLGTQPEETLPDIQGKDEAIRYLSQTSAVDKPFFLALGLHKPHVPFKFPKKYLDLYPLEHVDMPDNPERPALMPTIAWNPWRALRQREDIAALNLSFPFGPMTRTYTRLIRQHYYASVSYMDDLVGEVLNALDKNGLSNNTIVNVIGDHGWSLGEHQEWAKFSNFEVALRVPWIVHTPKMATAKTITNPVELVDVFPTLVDLAGLPSLSPCPTPSSEILLCTEGQSRMSSIVSLDPDPDSFAFSQYPRPTKYPVLISDKPRLKHIHFMGYTVRSVRYRYTMWVPYDQKRFRPDFDVIEKFEELYDHLLDEEENNNVEHLQNYRLVKNQLQTVLTKQFAK